MKLFLTLFAMAVAVQQAVACAYPGDTCTADGETACECNEGYLVRFMPLVYMLFLVFDLTYVVSSWNARQFWRQLLMERVVRRRFSGQESRTALCLLVVACNVWMGLVHPRG